MKIINLKKIFPTSHSRGIVAKVKASASGNSRVEGATEKINKSQQLFPQAKASLVLGRMMYGVSLIFVALQIFIYDTFFDINNAFCQLLMKRRKVHNKRNLLYGRIHFVCKINRRPKLGFT